MMDPRSEKNLAGVHPDLARVVRRVMLLAADPNNFFSVIVTEGRRTLERQRELIDAGASHTMRSRHLTGHAVDLAVKVAGEVRWDWPLYAKINGLIQEVARSEGVPVEWGGAWRKFKDGPHFQLPWKEYPA